MWWWIGGIAAWTIVGFVVNLLWWMSDDAPMDKINYSARREEVITFVLGVFGGPIVWFLWFLSVS